MNTGQNPILDQLEKDLDDAKEIVLVYMDRNGQAGRVVTNGYHVRVCLVPTICIYEDPYECHFPMSEFSLDELLALGIKLGTEGKQSVVWLRKYGEYYPVRIEDDLQTVEMPDCGGYLCDLESLEVAMERAKLESQIAELEVRRDSVGAPGPNRNLTEAARLDEEVSKLRIQLEALQSGSVSE